MLYEFLHIQMPSMELTPSAFTNTWMIKTNVGNFAVWFMQRTLHLAVS